MEIRNLQKTGGSSLTLTLPKQWVTKYHLEDKHKVMLNTLNSGELTVSPYFIKKIEVRSTIAIDHFSTEKIIREIIAHYISGVDVLSLKAEKFTPEQVNAIRSAAKDLIGMELLEQTSKTAVIKNIFDSSKFSIHENVQKMFSMIITMYKDMLHAMETRDKSLAFDIVERDDSVDKLYLAIIRQFRSLLQNRVTEEELGLSPIDLYYYEAVTTQLERIADHTVKVAKMIILQSKKSQQVFTLSLKRRTKKILLYLEQVEKAYRLLDKNSAHAIVDYHRTFTKNVLINKSIVKKSSIDIIIEDSVDRIRGYITNVAEEVIDYIVIKQST